MPCVQLHQKNKYYKRDYHAFCDPFPVFHFAMFANMPDFTIAWFLFCVGDRQIRVAVRVACTSVNQVGEAARLVVAAKALRRSGNPSPCPIAHQRSPWWAPWVGVIQVLAPEPEAHPAATGRCTELLTIYVSDMHYYSVYRLRIGRDIHGIRYAYHPLRLLGCSNLVIPYKTNMGAVGWVSNFLIFATL